jgi:hypothetical protein
MSVVNEIPLPGIGGRYEFVTHDGLGPLAACYVLLLAVCGPLLARVVDRPARRLASPR